MYMHTRATVDRSIANTGHNYISLVIDLLDSLYYISCGLALLGSTILYYKLGIVLDLSGSLSRSHACNQYI